MSSIGFELSLPSGPSTERTRGEVGSLGETMTSQTTGPGVSSTRRIVSRMAPLSLRKSVLRP